MTEINLDSKVVASKQQVSCDLGEEAAILNTHTGIYYGLNTVGARIWAVLQEEKLPVRELLAIIVKEFKVEPGRCQEDVLAVLRQMASEGLIEIE